MRCTAALLVVMLGASTLAGVQPVGAAACTFKLGFKALHDQIPDVVGDCTENEHPDAATGNTLQATTHGLLVWRSADNWTAFTDGGTTWINEPCGLQSRSNDTRFPWENGGSCANVGSPYAPFVGYWARRDAEMSVFDSGYARFRWMTGACYPGKVGPCDQWMGNLLIMGGLAEFQLTAISPGGTPTASGYVMTTNGDLFRVPGAISLVRLASDLVLVTQEAGASVYLCVPPRDPNSCD